MPFGDVTEGIPTFSCWLRRPRASLYTTNKNQETANKKNEGPPSPKRVPYTNSGHEKTKGNPRFTRETPYTKTMRELPAPRIARSLVQRELLDTSPKLRPFRQPAEERGGAVVRGSGKPPLQLEHRHLGIPRSNKMGFGRCSRHVHPFQPVICSKQSWVPGNLGGFLESGPIEREVSNVTKRKKQNRAIRRPSLGSADTDRQTDRPTDGRTDSQTDRPTDKRTNTHTQMSNYMLHFLRLCCMYVHYCRP